MSTLGIWRVLRRGAPWGAGTFLLIAGALAVFFVAGSAAGEDVSIAQDYRGDISFGAADAKVVLVEYADFQCAACAEYARVLAPIREEYKDRVRFVFRFFPLSNHEWATASSQVAYAAFLQGKFWEMHDILYQRQAEWSQSADPTYYFDRYARALGLEIERFHQDANAKSTLDFISGQAERGTEQGVSHTPWFFLNGSTLKSPKTGNGFRDALEAVL